MSNHTEIRGNSWQNTCGAASKSSFTLDSDYLPSKNQAMKRNQQQLGQRKIRRELEPGGCFWNQPRGLKELIHYRVKPLLRIFRHTELLIVRVSVHGLSATSSRRETQVHLGKIDQLLAISCSFSSPMSSSARRVLSFETPVALRER